MIFRALFLVIVFYCWNEINRKQVRKYKIFSLMNSEKLVSAREVHCEPEEGTAMSYTELMLYQFQII
jgi:hypothetical protein